MGIDYDGGMIVGEVMSNIQIPDEYESMYGYYLYLEDEHDMYSMHPYYDADVEDWAIGFQVPDVKMSDVYGDSAWYCDLKYKAKQFKDLTGVEARLIGTQNIY